MGVKLQVNEDKRDENLLELERPVKLSPPDLLEFEKEESGKDNQGQQSNKLECHAIKPAAGEDFLSSQAMDDD
jgi:hypothetical protein